MSDRVRGAFQAQARACDRMGSALTARVLRVLAGMAGDGPVAARVLAWPGDPSPTADALALRLAAGLHALVLSGADPQLAAIYAAPDDCADPVLRESLARAMKEHPDHLMRWLDSPPQTNEVRRSAVLIAAGHHLAARCSLPFVLSEAGASAGMNLWWDRYALEVGGQVFGPADSPVRLAPEWTGPLPPQTRPLIAERAGADLSPLHPRHDSLRLMSYLWAGQPDRVERTRAALRIAAENPAPVVRADAVDWLAGRLARPMPGRLHLVFHTVAWQYLPAAAQARGEALIAAAGARATADAPLARLAMEADGGEGAAVTLTLWPGGKTACIARADFHGRWVQWLE